MIDGVINHQEQLLTSLIYLLKLTENDSTDWHYIETGHIILSFAFQIVEYAISQFHGVLIEESYFNIVAYLCAVEFIYYSLSVS